ncbi:MAG: hypothetical protein K2X94_03110 [Amoebophilaceae bacterium]|nr:hypothetical protein [Amoebophilaceae bacterium]
MINRKIIYLITILLGVRLCFSWSAKKPLPKVGYTTLDRLDQQAMPLILSCSGMTLTEEERSLFQSANPMGFILFNRNIKSKAQTLQLIKELKNCLQDRSFFPILIDEEGGRVDRLRQFHADVEFPPALNFGRAVREGQSIIKIKQAVVENAKNIAKLLRSWSFNVNCAPVSDLYDDELGIRGDHTKKNPAIGNRSFSAVVDVVVNLSDSFIKGQADNGVLSIIKHIPGHGLAVVDSHKELPVVSNSLEDLEAHDFKVFKNLAGSGSWGMVSHIVYDALDHAYPASQSAKAIAYIRDRLGFENVLLSDAIEMQALKGSMGDRALKSLEAGLDLVIYGAGEINDMRAMVKTLTQHGYGAAV